MINRYIAPLAGLHVIWVQLRVAIMHEAQYRAHLAMQLLATAASVVTALLGLEVLFHHGGSINGWSRSDLLVIVGLYIALTGMVNAIVQPSLKLLMEQIRLGTLDFTLMKPRDAQLLVSTQKIDPWKLLDVVAGCIIIAIGAAQTTARIGVYDGIAFVITASCGAVCVYNVWIALSTLSFWFIRVGEVLDIARTTFDGGRWPVSMYPGWLRQALTFVVPVGLGVTIPAEALLGRGSVSDVALVVVCAVISSFIGRATWRVALGHYSGASA